MVAAPPLSRIIRVHIGARDARLVISEVRISFALDFPANSTQVKGHARLYNLAAERENRIQDRGESIAIEAGYPRTVGQLHNGSIQRVRRRREGLAKVTTIDLGDTVHSPLVVGGATARTYAGAVSVREIIRDLAGDLRLVAGPLDAIPDDATVSDWSWSGTTKSALADLTERVGCSWYEDEGALRVRRRGESAQSDGYRVRLTPDTGLVRTPEVTDQGVEATAFLNPLLKRGGSVVLESETAAGTFTVVAVKHTGDNWAGPFTTWVDLRTP